MLQAADNCLFTRVTFSQDCDGINIKEEHVCLYFVVIYLILFFFSLCLQELNIIKAWRETCPASCANC